MMQTGKALFKFFGSFGIPAYEENSVPDDAVLPYITFEQADTTWDRPISISASVWYAGTSLTEVFSKVDEIKEKLGEGYRIPTESGCLWLYKDTSFAQVLDADADSVKRVVLNIGMHALTK